MCAGVDHSYNKKVVIKHHAVSGVITMRCAFVETTMTARKLQHYEAQTASMVQWSEFLATDPEVPGSIPDVTTFSEK
jgi:hypothetical protein